MLGFRHEARALGSARLSKAARIEHAVDRDLDRRLLVERAQMRGEARGLVRIGEVRLGDDDAVGEDRLLAASADHSSVDTPLTASTAVSTTSTKNSAPSARSVANVCRIGPGSASPEVSIRTRSNGGSGAAVAIHHQAAQRHLQIGARDAADAAVAQKRDLVGRSAHQRVVDADRAVFIDDDCGGAAFRRREEAPHQRGLAGPRKPVTIVTGMRAPRARFCRRPNGPRSREWEEVERGHRDHLVLLLDFNNLVVDIILRTLALGCADRPRLGRRRLQPAGLPGWGAGVSKASLLRNPGGCGGACLHRSYCSAFSYSLAAVPGLSLASRQICKRSRASALSPRSRIGFR
jgi:hypothetical protein